MHSLLEAQRDAVVDVQVGLALYEDAPQELRSRLWMALLEHPELGERYHSCVATLHAADVAAVAPTPETTGTRKEAGPATAAAAERDTQEQGAVSPATPAPTPAPGPSGDTNTVSSPGAMGQEGDDAATPAGDALPSSEREREDGWDIVLEAQPRQGKVLLQGATKQRTAPWNVSCEAFRNGEKPRS
jgi:hypothetical protein